jgi:type IV pilus assembly protein PilM
MDELLKNIKNLIGGSFTKKENSVIGIDIGAAFLKVIQLKKSGGKAILETYGELALGPYAGLEVGQATNLSSSKMSEAIKDLFKEANITTLNSGMSLPLSASLMSLIDMPMMDNNQLKKMIPIEARKYIPVPISEVTLDWWILPKEKKDESAPEKQKPNKLKVLIVAIHNELINRYKDIIKSVGLKNSFLELEVFCTARSTFGNHMPSVMILDLGAGSTKISIMEYGIIKSQHSVSRGSQDITLALSRSLNVSIKKAEEMKIKIGLSGMNSDNEDEKKVSESIDLVVGNIFSETNRVLLNYQRLYNKTIKNVVLTGGGSMMKGLSEFAAKNLETEVVYADPFSKVETPAFLEKLLKEVGPSFAVSVGIALRKLQEIK